MEDYIQPIEASDVDKQNNNIISVGNKRSANQVALDRSVIPLPKKSAFAKENMEPKVTGNGSEGRIGIDLVNEANTKNNVQKTNFDHFLTDKTEEINIIEKLETTSSGITLGSFCNSKYSETQNILSDDIQTLLPRRWLNEKIINLYFHFLTVEYSDFGYIPASSHPIFRSKLKQSSTQKNKILMKFEEIENVCTQLIDGEIDSILIPLHVYNWILAIISGDGIIYIYDTGNNQSKIKHKVDELFGWVQQKFNEIEWDLSFITDSKIDEVDKFNLSILVPMCAETFCKLKGKSMSDVISKVNEIDPNEFRNKMAKKLFDHYSLNFPSSITQKVDPFLDVLEPDIFGLMNFQVDHILGDILI